MPVADKLHFDLTQFGTLTRAWRLPCHDHVHVEFDTGVQMFLPFRLFITGVVEIVFNEDDKKIVTISDLVKGNVE